MSQRSLSEVAKKMRDIDIAMLSTHTDGGAIAARPMSNNGDVEYDGDSYYFTWEKSRMVDDIRKNSKVGLSFQGKKAFSVAVEGEADVIKDKEAFKEHWTPDLDDWFKDGIDTKGVVMIKVSAVRAHYWDGEDEGEVKLPSGKRH
ncbi:MULTISPECIES: pyridoxamine 5'-phosphate oxidase family protein [unclassified Rhizobium]|uniref:pyridoxamine 5'-phosphate oxidase family protein n=1 Tax=unclassified Rhizobium TaxID=2613769 RepID=UPI0007148010|nr:MULTISPECIES: pyridoxamine 5'-phosphate oxidase family protein [unclassified Rhizobium]KQS90419.1 pyridoxamine 5'-phosphate oxidase [Rhizobium sp. Leaf386]KQS90676.1 pyridoxamine 5'-phosphate oxidase [Rhizobium sp. Leaf391]KQU10160.1 pyridoxamine 5'-phosphate oxidase [Rhizobium sp. Leaf453]